MNKIELAYFKRTSQYGDYYEYKVIREYHKLELRYSVSSFDSDPKSYIYKEPEYLIIWKYSRNKYYSKYKPNFMTYAKCKVLYEEILNKAQNMPNSKIEIIKEFPIY